MRRSGGIVVALLIGVVLATGARASFPGRAGVLVATNARGLVLIAPRSGARRLIPGTADKVGAVWSADGKRLAFTRVRDVHLRGGGEALVSTLFVMRPSGTGVRRVVDNAEAPSWSPDGKHLAFMRDPRRLSPSPAAYNGYEIYVTDISGRHVRRLTSNYDYDGDPAWSPDGKTIAFDTTFDVDQGIDLINADGSDRRVVIHDGSDPSWSPDGTRLAFDGPGLDIFVADSDGRHRVRLTDNPGPDYAPVWSPDGRKIAFSSNVECGRSHSCTGETPLGVWVVNADGTRRRQLTPPGYYLSDWQPLPR